MRRGTLLPANRRRSVVRVSDARSDTPGGRCAGRFRGESPAIDQPTVAAPVSTPAPPRSRIHMSRHAGVPAERRAWTPAGFTHYGLHVENIKSAVEMFKQHGVTVSDVNKSGSTNALLANINDPYMGRIELAELTPDSLHRKALDSWKP